MNKEVKSKGKAPKSNAPMLIIGAVLLGAVLGGWWYYNSTKGNPAAANSANAANKAANTSKTNTAPTNAPQGAQPPNFAGSVAAAVTLEEFADYQCGACAIAHPVMNEIKSLYGSRIKFIFRNYPLAIPAHDKAYDAAVAAEAAGLQGKFWDMQNLLFTNQQAWTAAPSYRQIWKGYAEKIGLEVPKWENDMAGIIAKGRVDADKARGSVLGVSSTPTLYINGTSVPFAEMNVQALKAKIDAELQKAAPQKDAPAAPATQPSNK